MSELDLFAQARRLPDPAERAAFLNLACAEQPDLRRRVDALLSANDAAGDFLVKPHPAAETVQIGSVHSPWQEATGKLIAGRYQLLQRIGEGGMGTVWMADQLEPVKRRVAVKLIRPDRDGSQAILRRFEVERQAIALMNHPNIARLLDAGTVDDRPYFVMELIEGIPLTDYCDQHTLNVPARLRLFIDICSAVQHAHQKGVIHRDLKPTNILVEQYEGRAVPRIIDFGLAKALSGPLLTDHSLTNSLGRVAGTPLYMAPEQAVVEAVDVDTRADIYSLGVILYELLTGSTPIERAQMKQAAHEEILRVIREVDPPEPSKRVSSPKTDPMIAEARRTDVIHLARFVRGDLDCIVMKSLAKERVRRYDTAAAFAEDVQRYLRSEPVLASPPSALYRLKKLLLRHRRAALTAASIVVTLIAAITSTTFGLLEARRKTLIAEESRKDSIRHLQDLKSSRRRLFISNGFNAFRNRDPLEALAWYTSAFDNAEGPGEIDRLRIGFCMSLCPRVDSAYWLSGSHRPNLKDTYSRELCESGTHFITADGIVNATDGTLVYQWPARGKCLATYCPNETRLLAVKGDDSIDLIWLDPRWSPQKTINLVPSADYQSFDLGAQFSANGAFILLRLDITGFTDGVPKMLGSSNQLRLYSTDGHESWRLSMSNDEGAMQWYRLSADARRLAVMMTKSQKSSMHVYSLEDGVPPKLMKNFPDIVAGALSPKGNELALLTANGSIEVHALESSDVVRCGGISTNPFRGTVVWSPDGKQVFAAGESECVSVPANGSGLKRNVTTNPLKIGVIDQSDQPIAFSADGKTMALVHKDGTCTVSRDGRPEFATLYHHELIEHVDVSADGRRVLTRSSQQTKVWKLPDAPSWIESAGELRPPVNRADREKRLKIHCAEGRVESVQDDRAEFEQTRHHIVRGALFPVSGQFSAYPDREGSQILVATPFPMFGAYLWNPSTGAVFSSPAMQRDLINNADIQPGGKVFVTHSVGRQLREQWTPAGLTVWDAELGLPMWAGNATNLERDVTGSGACHFSEDGQSIKATMNQRKYVIHLPSSVDLDVARDLATAGSEATVNHSGIVQAADAVDVRRAWERTRMASPERSVDEHAAPQSVQLVPQ